MGRFLRYWWRCVKIALRGTCQFANDWNWLFGTPILAFAIYFLSAGNPEMRFFENAILNVLAAATIAFCITFAIKFFHRLFATPSALYWESKQEIERLEDQLKPSIKCHFDILDAGCVRPNTTVSALQVVLGAHSTTPELRESRKRGVYYRIAVEAAGTTIVEKCTGYITLITKNLQPCFVGEKLLLTFAPAEGADSTAKDLRPQIREHLDFMFIGDDNRPVITTKDFKFPSSINTDELFSERAEYVIHIVISPQNGMPTHYNIRFIWTGLRDTARLIGFSPLT